MTRVISVAVLLAGAVAITSCAPRPRYYRQGYSDRGYYQQNDRRAAREFTDEDAWEVVRRDPCRYEEYRRYADKHKNPEKRREVVWQLARDGCSRQGSYEYDRRGYPAD
jgi:hypothetical protein